MTEYGVVAAGDRVVFLRFTAEETIVSEVLVADARTFQTNLNIAIQKAEAVLFEGLPNDTVVKK